MFELYRKITGSPAWLHSSASTFVLVWNIVPCVSGFACTSRSFWSSVTIRSNILVSKPGNYVFNGLLNGKTNQVVLMLKRIEQNEKRLRLRSWGRVCEQEGVRLKEGGKGKGLALLKDREGQITNNKTERQRGREGGRGGKKKRAKENMLSEGEGRREWKRESYVCQERCTSRCDWCSSRIFSPLSLISFIYLPLFFYPS